MLTLSFSPIHSRDRSRSCWHRGPSDPKNPPTICRQRGRRAHKAQVMSVADVAAVAATNCRRDSFRDIAPSLPIYLLVCSWFLASISTAPERARDYRDLLQAIRKELIA